MAERAVFVRLSVKDQEAAVAALRAFGEQGERALKRIEGAAQPASRGLQAVDAVGKDLTSRLESAAGGAGVLGSGLRAIGPAGLAAAAALTAASAGVVAIVKAGEAAERSLFKTEAMLKATGQASGLTARQIDQLAVSIGEATLISTKEAREAAAALLTFRSVSGETFGEVLKLSADLASVGFGSITSAAQTLGRALEDPERGMTALRRAGIVLNAETAETIKRLNETGRASEATALLLEELRKRVGGAAEGEAQGLAGAFDDLGDQLERFLELAADRSGVLEKLAGVMRGIAAGAQGTIAQIFPSDQRRYADLGSRLLTARGELDAINAPGALGSARFKENERARLEAEINAILREREEIEARIAAARKEQEDAAAAGETAQAEIALERQRAAEAEKAQKAEEERQKQRTAAIKELDSLQREAALAGLEGEALLAAKRDEGFAQWAEHLENNLVDLTEFNDARLALEEIYQKEVAQLREREAEREREKQRRAEERAYEERKRQAERSTDDIVRYGGDRFADLFAKNRGGWKAMLDNMKDTAIATFGRIAAELLLRPIVAPIVGQFMGVAGGGGGAGGGVGSIFSSVGNLFGSTGGSGGGMIDLGLGGLTTAIDSFGASLGLSSVAGGGNTLYGLAGLEAGAVDAGFIAGEGALSATGSLSGILGGAGLGFAAGSLLNSLVGGKKTGGMIGSGAGALAGAVIGSIIPGIGTILGGLIGGAGGGLLGGLFGPGKGFSGGQINLGVDAAGNLITTEAGFKRHKDVEGAKAAAQQFVDSINRQFDQLGLSFSAGGNLSSLGFGDKAGSIEWSVGRLLDSGRVQSGNADLDSRIKSMSLSGSADEIMARLGDLVTVFNALQDPTAADNLTQAEQALKQIGETFDTLRDKAKALGFSTAELAELEEKRAQAIAKLTEGFDRSIELQILGFTDPLGQAMESLADAQAERLREAKAAGADLVQVEKLSALERQRVLEQFNRPLKAFYDHLQSGAGVLGVQDQMGFAEGRFNELLGQVQGGDFSKSGDLAAAAAALDALKRTAFAGSPAYFEFREFLLKTVGNVLGAGGYAEGTSSASPGWHWVGERGPELMRFRGGEQVIPANAVRQGGDAVGREVVMGIAEMTSELRRVRASVTTLSETVHRQQDTIDRLLSAPGRAAFGR